MKERNLERKRLFWNRLFGRVIFKADVSFLTYAEKKRFLESIKVMLKKYPKDFLYFDGKTIIILTTEGKRE